MDTGLELTVIDVDEDYLGLAAIASNGRFRGSIRKIYAGFGEVSQLADGLAGLVLGFTGERNFELGDSDTSGVTGIVRLTFQAADGLGHIVLSVEMETADWVGLVSGPRPESASFAMLVDPASIERFVSQLRAMESCRAGVARLESPS